MSPGDDRGQSRHHHPGHHQHDDVGAEGARQGAGRQQTADEHARDRDGEHPGCAHPPRPDHEDRRHQQVEHHLVRKRPEHVDDADHLEEVLEHGHVRQSGQDRMLAQLGGQLRVNGDERERGADGRGHQPQRVDAEHPADPEPGDAAPPFERGGHHVAADDEEQHDAVLAEVEPGAGARADLGEEGVEQVFEEHGEHSQPAQGVQPGLPAGRRGRLGRPRPVSDPQLTAASASGQVDGHRVRLGGQPERNLGVCSGSMSEHAFSAGRCCQVHWSTADSGRLTRVRRLWLHRDERGSSPPDRR